MKANRGTVMSVQIDPRYMGAATTRRAAVALLVIGLLSLPALANSGGPPYLNSNGDPTAEYGCNCHNNGQISDRAVIMVTGVPIQYSPGEEYPLVIKVADAHVLAGDDGNTHAGFLMTSGGAGSFTWADDQQIRIAEDSENDVSHSDTSDDGIWALTWISPADDEGAVYFWLAGNAVNGDGAPGDDDYWNMLSFTVNAPGTLAEDDSSATLETRTVSVGAYDALFLIEESPEKEEEERQKRIADAVFSNGNQLYWASLVALIIGAVFQREILERRYDEGPEPLATELAYPQGIRRGGASLLALAVAITWTADGVNWFLSGTAYFCAAWAAYGVYRTILAARAPVKPKDML